MRPSLGWHWCDLPSISHLLLSAMAGLYAEALHAQAPRAAAGSEPLRIEEALGARALAALQQVDLSSDGALVAYTVIDERRAALLAETDQSRFFTRAGTPVPLRGSDVLMSDVRTGTSRTLSSAPGNSWAPVWSPDGQRLVFYSDRDGAVRLWVWERGTGTIRRLSEAAVHTFFGFENPRWSPDGRRVLVKLLPSGMTIDAVRRLAGDGLEAPAVTADPSAVTARIYSTVRDTTAEASPAVASLDSTPSAFNVSLSDLALVDAAGGRVVRVARRVRVMGYEFAPGGRRIAFSTRQPYRTDGSPSWSLFDLWVVDTAGEGRRLLAPRVEQEYGLNFSVSPNGRRLAYLHAGGVEVRALDDEQPAQRVTQPGGRFVHGFRRPLWADDSTLILVQTGRLWRIDPASGVAEPAGAVPGRQIVEIVAPAHASHLAGGPRGTVLVATRHLPTMRMGFFQVDLGTGNSRAFFEDDVSLGSTVLAYHLDAEPQSKSVVFVSEAGARPADVWIAQNDFSRPRSLTRLNPAFAARALGRSRLISWTTASGDTLRGALLLPTGYVEGKRYPLVVKVYGGLRLSGRVHRFGFEAGVDNLQLFATRGYAVLLPDAPVRVGTPMADLAAAVLPGVDAVIALGIADPERVGVFGHSYGGYSVLALLVQTERFSAAVSSAGYSNLLNHYTDMRPDGSTAGIGFVEGPFGYMGTSPWQARDRYIENSPFFLLDRVTAPVLLLHGAEDQAVFPARAQETFVALRRLGKRAELAIYAGEKHSPGSWRLSNAVDYYDRIFMWFNRHLKRGAVAPDR